MRRAGLLAALLLGCFAGVGCGGDGVARPPFCPAGTAGATLCIRCGTVGGCAQTDVRCLPVCTTSSECTEQNESCLDGVCKPSPGCL